MNLNDPVSDMLARLRNAVARKHRRVPVPYSRLKEGVLRVLKQEGFVEDYQVVDNPEGGAQRKMLFVYPKYNVDGECALRELLRKSKPGCRVFVMVDKIPRVRDGLGIAVLSTSRGILSDKEARTQKVGGELICTVW